jgi:multidrug resistance efflux pump
MLFMPLNNLSDTNGLVSNEMAELISYRPHWVIRKGNAIFLFILFLLLAFTWFIKYPDIVKGSVKLVAIDAPKLLVAKTEGKLQKLVVVNEQDVEQGQPLAFLQSTADPQQVILLRNEISAIEPFILRDSLEIVLNKSFPAFDQLGGIQGAYEDFQGTLKETIQLLANGYYQQKKKALQRDLYYLTAIQTNTREQQDLIKQDVDLQQKEYVANESLAKDKVIAPLELNQNKSKVIGKQQSLAQMNAQMINNSIAEQAKRKEMLDLQKYVTDQQLKFRSSLFTLKSKVEEWIQQYVIIAPEKGKVLFTSFLQENQLLTSGQELFYLQPHQSLYYGQMLASQTGLGKIKTGQRVLIRVESFPSNEFGYLTGRVSYISTIPTARDSFLIKVDLPRGLETNYNKTIFFRNGLMAGAEVLTDNRRLFDRFLGQLKDLGRR